MREIVHIQAGQCGNQIGAKVGSLFRGLGKNRSTAPPGILGHQRARWSSVNPGLVKGVLDLLCAIGWGVGSRRP